MDKIIQRWKNKSLSQIFTLLSGIVMVIILVDKYTAINITKLNHLMVVKLRDDEINSKMIMWILSALQYISPLFDMFRYFSKKKFSEQNDMKYYKSITILYTIEDIVNVVVSIYGLLFMLGVYDVYINQNLIYNTPLFKFTYCALILRFGSAVYYHFHYKNLSVVNKSFQEPKSIHQ